MDFPMDFRLFDCVSSMFCLKLLLVLNFTSALFYHRRPTVPNKDTFHNKKKLGHASLASVARGPKVRPHQSSQEVIKKISDQAMM